MVTMIAMVTSGCYGSSSDNTPHDIMPNLVNQSVQGLQVMVNDIQSLREESKEMGRGGGEER